MMDTVSRTQIDSQLQLLAKDTSQGKLDKDTNDKLKELKNLLIEYILAQMKGDAAKVTAIQNQIGALLNAYGKEVNLFQQAHALIKTVESDPSDNTAATLAALIHMNQEINSLTG
jgi:hypothetical protein